jgi:hypothetical protein
MVKATNNGRMENGKGGAFVTGANPFHNARVGGFPMPDKTPLLVGAICAVLRAECAIIIGTTRDGGALSLTVLDGDQRHKTYCSSEAELSEAAKALIEMYT